MRHPAFALLFALILSTSASAREPKRLDNETVIDALSDQFHSRDIFAKGQLTINGESRGECEISKSLDDNHFGHVFKIIQDDKIVAYATIWSRKSRVDGWIDNLSRGEKRIFARIDNGSRNVREETINLQQARDAYRGHQPQSRPQQEGLLGGDLYRVGRRQVPQRHLLLRQVSAPGVRAKSPVPMSARVFLFIPAAASRRLGL